MNENISAEYQSKVGHFVGREVTYCVSSLIRTLANGYGSAEGEIGELCEKAFELSCPLDDWAEPVSDHVRNLDRENVTAYLENLSIQVYDHESIGDLRTAMISSIADEGEQDFCHANNLDPYQTEVFEHWIVSRHLADRLEKRGEKVDMDFDGLVVWARTSSGQSMSIDYVICKIYDEIELEIAHL